MGKTHYAEDDILAYYLNQADMPARTPTYVALFTSAPTNTGGGTEVSGNGYARQSTTGKFAAPANGAAANNAPITFPTPTASWGDVTYVGLFDALTGGNLLRYAKLTVPKNVASGDAPSFAAGDLVIRED